MMDFDATQVVNAIVERKTDKEREDEQRFQEEQRAKLSLPTPLEIRARLGDQMIALAEMELRNGENDFEYSRMAEGYALRGDYRKAVTITRDALNKRQYEAIINAVDNPSDCGCPLKTGTVSTRFVKDRILFDGQIRELIACANCGHLKC